MAELPICRMTIRLPDLRKISREVRKISLSVPFQETCEEVVGNAWKRIYAGQRATAKGGRYAGLAKTTKDYKSKHNFPETALIRTGKMIGDFRFWGKGNHWHVGFKTDRSFELAELHIKQGVRSKTGRVMRPFLRPDGLLTKTELKRHDVRSNKWVDSKLHKIPYERMQITFKI